MKLERLQDYVTVVTALIIGVGMAYWAGLKVGGGQMGSVAGVIMGFVFISLLLGMRQYVWVLIPLCWPLGGRILEIPGAPAVKDAAVVLVTAGVFMLVAFKIIRRKPKMDAVDFWMWGVLIYLGTVFVRNPVGGEVLNSDRVGGRAYLDTVIAVLAYWTLSRGEVAPGWGGRVIAYMVGVRLIEGLLSAVANIFPSTLPVLSRFYSGIDATGYERMQANSSPDEATPRQMYLSSVGLTLGNAMIATTRPTRLLNPLSTFGAMLRNVAFPKVVWSGVQQLGFFAAVVFVMLSGFRSNLAQLGAFFALGSFLRYGWREVGRLAALGALMLVMLVVLQGTLLQLPLPMQRALSFLPGKWNEEALQAAQHSSKWRIYMWEQMLFTDRYIQNKWLGDGFGFSASALQQMRATQAWGGVEEQQESFMIVGQVHSGPVSAVRFIGYFGLVIFTVLLFLMSRKAWRLCRRAQGTIFEALAYFVCIPIIWEPFQYWLIFGSTDLAIGAAVFNVGMLKMLENSLTLLEAPTPQNTRPTLPTGEEVRRRRRRKVTPMQLPEPAGVPRVQPS